MSEEDIVQKALKIDDSSARRDYIVDACGDDIKLRQKIESRIGEAMTVGFDSSKPPASEKSSQKPSDFAQQQTTQNLSHFTSPGETIGPYKLLQLLGEGGMGSVWAAEQKVPVRRTVALKIIKAGMDTREVIARFEAERQALAMMNHPNIAKVLDAGTTENGRPFFVMELVKGRPITRFCDKYKLTLVQRMQLFMTVCHAVQHAHQKGIIHRDIKPSNVLVFRQDKLPVAKVIDFGLAKATGQQLTEKTLFTALGQMVGTPAYMSPEQAGINEQDIDTRTDVYSLGVLLYELMTGETPIPMEDLRSAAYAEIQRLVIEQDPPRMSARLSSISNDSQVTLDNRSTDSRRLGQILRGDLDLIAMKALEKDRDRRYPTPSSFAADIERFLNDEEVEARAPSASYRLRKFYRRNKTAVSAGSAIAAAMVVGTFVSAWQAVVATNARDAETEQRQIADDALVAEREALTAERTAKEMAEKRLVQLEKIYGVIGSVFKDLDPKLEEQGGPPLRTQLLNRLAGLSELVDGAEIGDPLMVSKMQLTLGIAQNSLGDQEMAVELFENSLQLRESELGKDNLETIAVLVELGEAQMSVGKFPEAIASFKRAYDELHRQLGADDPVTLNCMSALAYAQNLNGDRAEGLELQQKALKLANEKLGDSDEETLQILNRLAGQNFDFDDREHDIEAKKLYKQHLELRKSTNGPNHYLTLQATQGLAKTALAQRDYDEAIELYKTVLAGLRDQLGAEHFSTVLANCSLAYAYDQSGESDEGLKLLEENVPKLKLLRGEDHPIYLQWLNLLAFSYENHDKLDEAIRWHKQALAVRSKKIRR